MKKFKPPKVIYISSFWKWNTYQSLNYKDKYVRINEGWKKEFKKQFPMLASDDARVIGFIERMVDR